MHNQAQTKKFTLLHTSDEHSVLMPLPASDYHAEYDNPTLGGFARLSGMVQQIKEEKGDEPVLLLSAGDFIGGSPYAWLILEGYSPELALMKQIGYDAATIGNHEFDYGPDLLAEYFLRLGYPDAHEDLPLIISNLDIPAQNKLEQVEFPKNRIIQLDNGLKVGIFGLLGRVAYSLAPYAEPVGIIDPLEVAQQQVSQLKKEGADVVIALSHSGIAEDREFAQNTEHLDIILGGHDHIQTPEPEVTGNTILLHSTYYLQNLGILELVWDANTGKVNVRNSENNTPFQIPLDHTVKEDSAVAEKVDYYTEKLNNFVGEFTDNLFTDVYAYVMESEFDLRKKAPKEETTIGNFLTDAMRLESEKVLGERVDIAFQANGVIRGDIIPGTRPWSEGKVSFMDLATIAGLGSGPDQKAGYPLVSVYLTAQEVYNLFEIASLISQLMGDTHFLQFSGARYTYDPGKTTWIKIPLANLPVPAYRAVQEVKIFHGEGIQNPKEMYELDTESDKLYHLVSDYYLTSFLPMIGEILPRLNIVLKDKNGNPVDLDSTIIRHKGTEFKVWEAMARYAVSFEEGPHGLPAMPEVYKNTQGRIKTQNGVPLAAYSYGALAAIAGGLFFLGRWVVRKVKRSRKRA